MLSMYVPIGQNSARDFSLTIGLGTAKLITGYAPWMAATLLTIFMTNSAVNFAWYEAGLDFYLSQTGLMQSKFDDFGITIDPAGSANLTAKKLKINEVNIGLKK